MSGMNIGGMGIAVLVIAIIVFLIAFARRYKRCPPDKIMVISGKTGGGASKCIHGGAAFIVPIIQEYQFLDLTPFPINVDLRGALSKQNIRVNVPATFTVGISPDPGTMERAAERLLGLPLRNVEQLAREIIFGQLRLVIATMDVEELNSQRDKFMSSVEQNVAKELNKIGLKMINANITDISDEAGYLDALGKEAEARAVNEAKKNVAERERDGNTGVKNEKMQEAIALAEKDRIQRQGVAEQVSKAIAAEKEYDKQQRAATAQAEAEAVAAEKKAELEKRAAVAQADAEAVSAEKKAEMEQRAAIANADAEAVSAENAAKAAIALSEAKRLEVEAEAKARATAAEKVQNARALQEAYAAEEKADLARAIRDKASYQADVIVPAEIEKQRIEIQAEAEAESIRRKAKGHADAIVAKMEAEAEGLKQQLSKRAEAYAQIVRAVGGNANSAVSLMMADKMDELLRIQVEAIKNIKIDKITVWDGMNGQDGSSTTSNFLNSVMKSIPPIKDMYDMIGVEVPSVLAGKSESTAAAARPAASPVKPAATPAAKV